MDARTHTIPSGGTVRRSTPLRQDACEGSSLSPTLLLFLSGVAALIYQVIWIKQLSLVVGIEVYAITMAVAAFFGGLALGGLVLGRLADRTVRPYRLYAVVEAGIAVAGVATTLTLARFAPAFAVLESHGFFLAWVLLFAIVGIPPFLMGGTLPVLVRALGSGRDGVSGSGAGLYAANTAGAIVGALLPMFVVIPAFGVQGSGFAAAALNLVAAFGAILLDRSACAPVAPTVDASTPIYTPGATRHRALCDRRRGRARL